MGYRLLSQPRPLWQGALGVGILCFLALSLVVFTRESPALPLFWDPGQKNKGPHGPLFFWFQQSP